jgi:hypothetical protein
MRSAPSHRHKTRENAVNNISMKVTRRLDRLKFVPSPASDLPTLDGRIIEAAIGEIVERILTPWDEPYRRQSIGQVMETS